MGGVLGVVCLDHGGGEVHAVDGGDVWCEGLENIRE